MQALESEKAEEHLNTLMSRSMTLGGSVLLSGKPSLYVLAGVNGAGKSSVGGAFLKQLNLPWYNPDSYARALVCELNLSQWEANSIAWQEGMAQLDEAIAQKNALPLKPR